MAQPDVELQPLETASEADISEELPTQPPTRGVNVLRAIPVVFLVLGAIYFTTSRLGMKQETRAGEVTGGDSSLDIIGLDDSAVTTLPPHIPTRQEQLGYGIGFGVGGPVMIGMGVGLGIGLEGGGTYSNNSRRLLEHTAGNVFQSVHEAPKPALAAAAPSLRGAERELLAKDGFAVAAETSRGCFQLGQSCWIDAQCCTARCQPFLKKCRPIR
eukprot:TRINITY_DN2599_c0_g1_i2.p1 TRINITY_DN2599_c0_g1~~TRINITY_DN2599_c0_g1_i2.p1  ORF type:complete len:214 (-),score=34.02 TRINITY_DN2599_c0_g1_i2:327-968(-)